MTELEKLHVTIQYRLNHARNNHMKTATIFTSTLSQIMEVINLYEALLQEKEQVPPEIIPGLSIERCGMCRRMITVDMNYCPKCGRRVERKKGN